MPSYPPKLTWIVSAFLVFGIVLLFCSQYAIIGHRYPESAWAALAVHFFSELGLAAIIASLVAVIFERLLAEMRVRSIAAVVEHYRKMEEAGFKQIYPDRQAVFDELFESALVEATQQVKIIGICVSLFKEAERGSRVQMNFDIEHIARLIGDLLRRRCTIQILYLKRYPTPDELGKYGLKEGDFFYMRERDEDSAEEFTHGKRLKKIANISLDRWIQVIVRIAMQTQSLNERRDMLNRIQIREYLALPSLSLFIVDQDIYVTPYLYRRHCSSVPAFRVSGEHTDLFRAYDSHFAVVWKDTLTTRAIPESFIDALIENPQAVVRTYEKKLAEIQARLERKANESNEFAESPERYRANEEVVAAIIAELNLPLTQSTSE